MKLSEFKGEEALEVLADLLEPVTELFSDKKLIELIKDSKTRIKGISYAIKEHKSSVLEILAITEGIPVDEYREKCNVMSLPGKALEIFNDKELMSFFSSQVPMEEMTSSGNVTEPTKDVKQ